MKLIGLALAYALTHSAAAAQAPEWRIVSEPFDYGPSSGNLPPLNGGTGWGTTWLGNQNGVRYEPARDLVPNSPTGLQQCDNAGTGGIAPSAGAQVAWRRFVNPLRGTIWMSFVVDYTPGNTHDLRVIARSANGAPAQFQFVLDSNFAWFAGRTPTTHQSPMVSVPFGPALPNGQGRQFLLQIGLDPAGPDTFRMWRDPDLTAGTVAGLGPALIAHAPGDLSSSWPEIVIAMSTRGFDDLRIAHTPSGTLTPGDPDEPIRLLRDGVLFPGIDADFEMRVGINAPPASCPVHHRFLGGGDTIHVLLDSPAGTTVGAPIALAADLFAQFPANGAFGLFLGQGAFVIYGLTPPFLAVLPPGGQPFAFDVPPGLGGARLMLQAAAFPAAGLATSHAHRLDF